MTEAIVRVNYRDGEGRERSEEYHLSDHSSSEHPFIDSLSPKALEAMKKTGISICHQHDFMGKVVFQYNRISRFLEKTIFINPGERRVFSVGKAKIDIDHKEVKKATKKEVPD